jgi:aminopeptidase
MSDPRHQKLAALLVNYSIGVQPGERIGIEGNALALPLLAEIYREVLRAGGLPAVIWREAIFEELLLKEGNDDQLLYFSEPHALVYETFDARIAAVGSENTRSLSGVEPQRQQRRAEGRRDIMKTFMERSAAGDLRWVGTLFPTQAHAQDADMSLSEFEDFVYDACFLNHDDPVAEWLKLSAMQQKLVDYLAGKKSVRVEGPNAEMTLSITDRTFINSDGHKNMPSGEIFTGPVEDSVNGWVRFTYPAIYAGREVEGIELRFENGKVVDAKAKKNEAFLLSVLDTDPGARYLGEWAIGTNNGIQRFTRSILFDEKIGGTMHMAVGAAYPETGGRNKSAVHWDMICDMRDGGKIFVDDELFYDSGRFVIL